jgi:hypothetical protein
MTTVCSFSNSCLGSAGAEIAVDDTGCWRNNPFGMSWGWVAIDPTGEGRWECDPDDPLGEGRWDRDADDPLGEGRSDETAGEVAGETAGEVPGFLIVEAAAGALDSSES